MTKTQRDTMTEFLADLVVELDRDPPAEVDPHDLVPLRGSHPKLHAQLEAALSRPPVPSHRHWDHPLQATYSDGATGTLTLQDALVRVLRGRSGDPLVGLAR